MRLGGKHGRLVLLAVVLAMTACSNSAGSAAPPRTTVGFILVGARDDLGYNQAVWEGQEAVARALPDINVVAVENVPENAQAEKALEDLIDDGATLLFATSFGHLEAAYAVAKRHPEVVVVHQGGVEPKPGLSNYGTYFGTHSEAMYAAGIAAGGATKSGRLGFVVGYPIPATFNNANAFLLGAHRLRPDASVEVVFTGSWCDPAAQRLAAQRLIAGGADVLGQHQGCTRTVLEEAEDAGIHAIGYHSDGSEVAPKAWLTGAVWTWSDLYIDIVRKTLAGSFAKSKYAGDFRGSLGGRDNPFALTEFGPDVGEATRLVVAGALRDLADGRTSVFTGPLVDDAAVQRVPAGESLDFAQIDAMDYFLDGVIVVRA